MAAHDVRLIFKLHVFEAEPQLAARKAATIEADAFVALHARLTAAGKGRTAAKLRSYLRAAYSLALKSKTDPDAPLELRSFRITANPIASIATLSRYFPRFNAGSGVPTLNRSHPDSLEVNVPLLPIQRRIAGTLSTYDVLIENSRRCIKILEAMARALYREWFVHFRFSGHESVSRVPSPLGENPKGWEVRKLGEIAEEMRRNVPKGSLEDPAPFVGLEHIPRRSLALDAWESTTELGSNKLEFNKGEVLFGKIRPYFHKVSVAPFDGLCSADTIVIRSRRQEHYAIVVGCVSSDDVVALATATSSGSKMPRASWSILAEHQIAVPPLTVARQFSAVIGSPIAQMQALVFQIQNFRRTRDLLLPRLNSGQIDVEALDHA